MTIAAIDIGTNTTLLLIARFGPDGSVQTVLDLHRYPRLGRGVDSHRALHPEAIRRVMEILLEYRGVISAHNPDRVVVAGTSAVRDATNRDQFSEQVRLQTGFNLEVLTGEEEAFWTFRGALSGFKLDGQTTVIDIGGGSTEVTVGDRDAIDSSASIDVGSVRMKERFLQTDPPSPHELAGLESFVRQQFSRLAPPPGGSPLVGVAGTATSLAILDQGIDRFQREAVTGYELKLASVERLCTRLGSLRSSEIRSLSEVMKDREDIITAGAVILRTFMQMFGFGSLIVSERGIRYGLVLRERERLDAV